MPESEACTLVCGHLPLSKHLSHDTCSGVRQAHSVMLTCMQSERERGTQWEQPDMQGAEGRLHHPPQGAEQPEAVRDAPALWRLARGAADRGRHP